MHKIEISIDEFIDFEPQPGIVKCSLNDAWNIRHTFIGKIPYFSLLDLSPENVYPQKGVVRCELINEWFDGTGRKILTVTTEEPDDIETTDNITKFDLLEHQVSLYRV